MSVLIYWLGFPFGEMSRSTSFDGCSNRVFITAPRAGGQSIAPGAQSTAPRAGHSEHRAGRPEFRAVPRVHNIAMYTLPCTAPYRWRCPVWGLAGYLLRRRSERWSWSWCTKCWTSIISTISTRLCISGFSWNPEIRNACSVAMRLKKVSSFISDRPHKASRKKNPDIPFILPGR